MSSIRVGICSWTDRTLLKSGFYPRTARTPAARLAHYAGEFAAVEVDATFYALPDPAYVFRWLAGTPKTFTFGVKSYALFTFHRARYASLPRWLREELPQREGADFIFRDDLSNKQRLRLFEAFVDPIRLMHRAERLAYILFQFPPRWPFSREGLAYFRRLREVCGPLPMAVEIRNASWLAEGNRTAFLRALERENIAYTAVDEPERVSGVGRDWPLTAEWGTLVRFHGRNEPAWRNPSAGVHERFDYLYRRSELAEWFQEIERAQRQAERIYLMYNNCYGDKAVQSARTMKELLGQGDGSHGARQTTLDFENESGK